MVLVTIVTGANLNQQTSLGGLINNQWHCHKHWAEKMTDVQSNAMCKCFANFLRNTSPKCFFVGAEMVTYGYLWYMYYDIIVYI